MSENGEGGGEFCRAWEPGGSGGIHLEDVIVKYEVRFTLDIWYPTFPVRIMTRCGRAPECTSLAKIAIDPGNSYVRPRRDRKSKGMAEKHIDNHKIKGVAFDEENQ